MNPAIWTAYLMDLSPEATICELAAREFRELELGDEHGLVLLGRGEPGTVGSQFRRFAAAQGVSVPQGHLWLDCDIASPDGGATLEKLKPWLDLYVAVGVKAAVLHPGGAALAAQGAPEERILDANVLALRFITTRLSGSGMHICLENCGHDAAQLKAIIAAAGGLGLAICLDTGHLSLLKRGQGEFIRQAGPLLKALHLHDNDGSGDQHLLPYGQGRIDWKDVFSALAEIRYAGLYNWEIPGERRGPLAVRLAKLDYLRAIWPSLSAGLTMDYDDMMKRWKQTR